MAAKRRGPGLAKATRGGTIRERQGAKALSREAEELIFRLAEILSEGSIRETAEGSTYFGSCMLTVELARLEASWRGPLDPAGREALRVAVEGSVRVKLRAMRIACAEAAHRVPDRAFGTASVETRVMIRDAQLHIDVDVEVPLSDSRRSSV